MQAIAIRSEISAAIKKGQVEASAPLRAKHAKHRQVIRELVAWEGYMGGWESPVWKQARRLAKGRAA